MSDKELAMKFTQSLPEQMSLFEIAQKIRFLAGVREGFSQLDRGESVPLEEVERLLPSWANQPPS
jgi:hypothetical protein